MFDKRNQQRSRLSFENVNVGKIEEIFTKIKNVTEARLDFERAIKQHANVNHSEKTQMNSRSLSRFSDCDPVDVDVVAFADEVDDDAVDVFDVDDDVVDAPLSLQSVVIGNSCAPSYSSSPSALLPLALALPLLSFGGLSRSLSTGALLPVNSHSSFVVVDDVEALSLSSFIRNQPEMSVLFCDRGRNSL